MKALKIISLAIVGLVVLVLISAAFIDSDYAVEREVVIDQPKDQVFDYVKYLKNQDNYSKWANMDPNMKKEYMGTDGAAGFVSSWESDNKDVGRGEQEIIAIKDGERIDYELRFYEPFETTDQAYMITERVNDSTTKVKWGFYGSMKYPMNLMLAFMDMETMLGDDLQSGLNGLKRVLE